VEQVKEKKIVNDEKILGLIGFAAKERKILAGKEGIRSYMKSEKKKKAVFLANDISKKILEDYLKRATSSKTEIYIFSQTNIAMLSMKMGKEQISGVAVEDDFLLKEILKKIEEVNNCSDT